MQINGEETRMSCLFLCKFQTFLSRFKFSLDGLVPSHLKGSVDVVLEHFIVQPVPETKVIIQFQFLYWKPTEIPTFHGLLVKVKFLLTFDLFILIYIYTSTLILTKSSIPYL